MPVASISLKPRLSTNILASSPTTSKVSRLAVGRPKLSTVSRRIRRPPMNGHSPRSILHQLAGQQLVADDAVLDEDAGVDRRDRQRSGPGGVVRPEQVGEVDRAAACPVTGPNGAARSMSGGREIAGRGDLAVAGPVDPALAGERALDQRDHALGQPGQLFRLQVLAEGDARERRGSAWPAPLDSAMLDGDVGDLGPARRMVERPVGAHHVAGEREVHIVAAQRIEARRRRPVGDGQRAVDGQVALIDAPAPGACRSSPAARCRSSIARRRRCRRARCRRSCPGAVAHRR